MTQYHRVLGIACLAGSLLGGCGSDDNSAASPAKSLFINELQPANQDTITDEMGEADDWIEIFNAGQAPVDMLGLSFTDSSGNSRVLPTSIVVPAGAFQLFWADDSPSQGPNHLGFKLSATKGDSVILKDSDGTTIDSVSFGPATGQNSYGRFPDGTGGFLWCGAPTPGASNGPLCLAP